MSSDRPHELDETAAAADDATAAPAPAPASSGTDATLAAAEAGATDSPVRLPEVSAARYRMAGELGRGGLGRVLRAHDVYLDRTVAVKELLDAGDGSRRRFVREALITARLEHPSIIPVYEAGRWPDRAPFYAMKLVGGQPLSDALAATRSLAERLALIPNVLAVVNAMAYAHARRIIHRDLKPQNVLLGAHGETVVIDWGLAKDLATDDVDALDAGPYRAASADRTVAGAFLGTPAYMAPEQAAGGDVDERADVYALGAMLYHVIAGEGPHRGDSLDDVIARIARGEIVPLTRRAPNAPRELAAIVAKAMAVDPAARYPSARELAEDLHRYTTDQLVAAHRYTIAQRVRRWLRHHRALAAAVLVLVAFAGWSVWNIGRERAAATGAARREVASQVSGAQRDVAFSLDQADPILARLRELADPDLPLALVGPRLDDLVVGRPGIANVSIGFSNGFMRGTFVDADTGAIEVQESAIDARGTLRRDYRVDGGGIELVGEERSDYDVRTRPHYQLAAAARRRIWTPPRIYFTSHTTGITCAEPVYGPDGVLIAVATVDFDVATLSQFITRPPLPGARSLVFTADGTVLAYPSVPVPATAAREGRLLRHQDFGDPAIEALFGALDPGARDLRFLELEDDRGDTYLAAVAPIGGMRAKIAAPLDWYVATIVPADALLGPIRARTRQSLAVLGAGALAIALGLLASRIVRRLRARQVRRTISDPSE